MYAFELTRAKTRRRRRRRARQVRRQGARRRPEPRRRDEAAPRAAGHARRSLGHRGAEGHQARTATRSSIGAMTRHAEVAASAVVKGAIPALAALAHGIGDRQVRNMGTLGGSIANNDPAADWPAARAGARRDRAHQQAQDRRRRLLQGHVRDGARRRRDHHGGELSRCRRRPRYVKFPNPASRFALVGVFVAQTGERRARGRDRRGACACSARSRSRTRSARASPPTPPRASRSMRRASTPTCTARPSTART